MTKQFPVKTALLVTANILLIANLGVVGYFGYQIQNNTQKCEKLNLYPNPTEKCVTAIETINETQRDIDSARSDIDEIDKNVNSLDKRLDNINSRLDYID